MKTLLRCFFILLCLGLFVSCLSTSQTAEVQDVPVEAGIESEFIESDPVEPVDTEQKETPSEIIKGEEDVFEEMLPVLSTDLSSDEAKKLFGGADTFFEVNTDVGDGSEIPKKSFSSSKISEESVILSPNDLHHRENGADLMNLSVDVVTPSLPVSSVLEEEAEVQEVTPSLPVAPVLEEEAEVQEATPSLPVTPVLEEEAEVQEATPSLPVSSVLEEEAEVQEATPSLPVSSVLEEEAEVQEATPSLPASSVLEEEAEVQEATPSLPVTPVLEEEAEVQEATPSLPVSSVLEEEAEVQEVTPSLPVEISRSVSMANRQYLDVVYPGSGWVYLGEVNPEGKPIQNTLLTYFGKRRNNTDTTFTLRSSSPGSTILHFYKQDILTATFIDDYMEVTINPEIAVAGSRITATPYSEIVPPYQYKVPNPADFKLTQEIQTEEALLESAENVIDATDNQFIDQSVNVEEQQINNVEAAENVAEQTMQIAKEIQGEDSVLSEPQIQSSPVPLVPQSANGSDGITVIQNAALESNSQDSFSTLEDDLLGYTEIETPMLTDGIGSTLGNSSTTTPLSQPVSDSEEISEIDGDGLSFLEKAQEEYYNENYKNAAEYLDKFFEVANSQLDAGLYLEGQIYEAKSEIQNIRRAISAYKKVIDQYPLSPFWQPSKNRETYLNRFYFDIR